MHRADAATVKLSTGHDDVNNRIFVFSFGRKQDVRGGDYRSQTNARSRNQGETCHEDSLDFLTAS